MAFRVERFREIDSTNAEAMRRARGGERGPLWIVADRQTAGRGRSGRSWESPAGNLHASLLTALPCGAEEASFLSLVAGVAIVDAMNFIAPEPVAGLRLKWPNDLLIGREKAGGVLIETSAFGDPPGLVAIVGIGLNLAAAPSHVENATSFARHEVELRPMRVLKMLAATMDAWLATWRQPEGAARVRQAWLDRAGPAGEPMSVNAGQGRVAGRFDGLDGDGALLLALDTGERRRFTFGDVTLIPSVATEA